MALGDKGIRCMSDRLPRQPDAAIPVVAPGNIGRVAFVEDVDNLRIMVTNDAVEALQGGAVEGTCFAEDSPDAQWEQVVAANAGFNGLAAGASKSVFLEDISYKFLRIRGFVMAAGQTADVAWCGA